MRYTLLEKTLKRIPLPIVIFFLIDIGLILMYVSYYGIATYYNKVDSTGRFYMNLMRVVDLDGESSFAAWFSSMQFYTIFLLGSIFAYHQIIFKKSSLVILILPAIFLLMSIDEAVQIHEWLGGVSDVLFPSRTRFDTIFESTGLWMFVIGIPFLLFFLWFIHSIKKDLVLHSKSLKKLVLGMLIMLSGALGFEFLSNFADSHILILDIVMEEGLEMIGATIMLWAVYEMTIDYIHIS